MTEYIIIGILSLALMLTHWRKKVWKRRFQDAVLMNVAANIGKAIGEVMNGHTDWPEVVDE